MDLEQIEKEYAEFENLRFKVSVSETINGLNVKDEVFILFKDAKPTSIRVTASRIKGKRFLITERGFTDRTFIKRMA